jgi:multiple sugar transport system substrate-binding protein
MHLLSARSLIARSKNYAWRWLAFSVVAVALLAACAAPAPDAAPAEGGDTGEAAEAEPAADGVFTYWGGLIFSDAANQMLVDRIEQWGEERGVEVDVVMINQNETVQRVSAAIEAGTMPDALDMGTDLLLLLSQSDQLEPLDDLYAEIGESVGGWLPAADEATNPERYGGHRYGIPFSLGGNVLYRRADVLEPAGYTEPPETWMELREMAANAQNPPEHYGMGFALSNVGDGNLTTTMLQSWGGRVADDAGENCTLDSPETREFVTWISDAFNEGLFPPGATTWDGAGDNVAYQSGNALFIANPGSVYLYMRDEDPELGEATKYSALPAGPEMRIAPVNANLRVIPKSTENKELAADLLRYLSEEEFMEEYYFNAIYGPSAEGYMDAPIFQESPVHQGLLDLAVNGTFGAFPDVDNVAFAEYQTNVTTPRMIQRVVVDGWTVDEAVMEAQEACQAIYDKYQTEE